MGFEDEIPSDNTSSKKNKSKPKELVQMDVKDVDGMNLFDKVAAYKSAIKIIQGELEIAEDNLKDHIRHKFVENIALLKKNGFKVSDYFDRTVKIVPSDRTMNDILDKVEDPDKVEEYVRKVSTIAIGTPNFDGDSDKAKEKIVGVLNESGIFTLET